MIQSTFDGRKHRDDEPDNKSGLSVMENIYPEEKEIVILLRILYSQSENPLEYTEWLKHIIHIVKRK